MLSEKELKNILSKKLNDSEKTLCCMAFEGKKTWRVAEIKQVGFSLGWRNVKKKNISVILSRLDDLVCRVGTAGWELTERGILYVDVLIKKLLDGCVYSKESDLRSCLKDISELSTRSFVSEAIVCFESRQYRAAVILSWVGAMSVLQNYVVKNRLEDFNKEVKKTNPRWKDARTIDDIGLIKEHTFLEILQSTSIIGKNVKQELIRALSLRNGCGHPNSLKVSANKVAAHIEDLILNVFSVYSYQS